MGGWELKAAGLFRLRPGAQFAAPDDMLTDSSFRALTNTLNNGRSLRLAVSFEF